MAIGPVSRGDLVLAVQPSAAKTQFQDTGKNQGQAGLFIVDSVAGDDIYVFAVSQPHVAAVVAGGYKADAIHLKISTDVVSLIKANSISA